MVGSDIEHLGQIAQTRGIDNARKAESNASQSKPRVRGEDKRRARRLESNRRTGADFRQRQRTKQDFYERRISQLEADNARLREALGGRASQIEHLQRKIARFDSPWPAVAPSPPDSDESEAAFMEWLAAQGFPETRRVSDAEQERVLSSYLRGEEHAPSGTL